MHPTAVQTTQQGRGMEFCHGDGSLNGMAHPSYGRASGVCDGGAGITGNSPTIAATKLRAAAIASVACVVETFEPGPVS